MTNDVRAEHFLGVPCTSELKSWREEEKQYLYLFIEDVWRIAASYWTTMCCYIAHFIPHHLTACLFVGVSKCEQPFIWTCLFIPPCVSLPELPIGPETNISFEHMKPQKATKCDLHETVCLTLAQKLPTCLTWNCVIFCNELECLCLDEDIKVFLQTLTPEAKVKISAVLYCTIKPWLSLSIIIITANFSAYYCCVMDYKLWIPCKLWCLSSWLLVSHLINILFICKLQLIQYPCQYCEVF